MEITFHIDDKYKDILGEFRLAQIINAMFYTAAEEIRLSQLFAETGAMRYPMSLRPEVLVQARVSEI